jgi:hypothetical protein
VRSVNLLKIAFDAELLRLRAMMARQGRRAAFAVIALIFALAVLALAEATGGLALRHRFESIPATLILLGGNLVIAAIFGVGGGVVVARSYGAGGLAGEAPGSRRGTGRAGLHHGRACRDTVVEQRAGACFRTLASPLHAIRPGEP